MEQPLVSIIIPLYRAEATLPQCLDSLRKQSYQRLELIFVDDCSPDGSYAYIEQEVPALESLGMRVVLLHQEENGGVARARSRGLDHATGEYVYWMDSDDLLAPEAIERMVTTAMRERADAVCCEYWQREGAKDRRMHQPEVKTGAEAFEQMCYGQMKWNLWLWMIRRELFELPDSLRFLSGVNMGEDMMLVGKLMHRAGRVSVIHEPLYTYVRAESQLTGTYRPEHWEQVQTNLAELESFLQRGGLVHSLTLLDSLKLSLKLPLLISTRWSDYRNWLSMFPESTVAISANPYASWRTKFIERLAVMQLFPLIWVYNKVVMQWLYRLLYR